MIETSTPVSPESEDQRLQIYNPNPAASWSVILTPLFGAYIIRENWLVLGNAEAAKRSFFWLIGLGLLYFLFFFTGLFDDFDYLVHLAALIIWYILECKPQVKFLKEQKLQYEKRPWLKPLGIGFAIWLIVVILSIIITAIFGAPRLDRSSPEAYNESCQVITEYLAEKYVKPLEQKEFRGELSNQDKEQVEAFKRLMLLLAVGNKGELNELEGWDADQLLDYAHKKLQEEQR